MGCRTPPRTRRNREAAPRAAQGRLLRRAVVTPTLSYSNDELNKGLTLPDGRNVMTVSSGDIVSVLSRFGIPGFASTNGREVNLQAYADFLANIGSVAATAAIQAWKDTNNIYYYPDRNG
jgi:hypothetical protein